MLPLSSTLPVTYVLTYSQASSAGLPYASRFPSSRYDASVPTTARYGSFLPSAWRDPPFPSSLYDPTGNPRLHTRTALTICYANPHTWPANSATPVVTAKSVPCTDKSGSQEEDVTQILRAELFPSEFIFVLRSVQDTDLAAALQDEVRSRHPKYYVAKDTVTSTPGSKTDAAPTQVAPEVAAVTTPDEARGKKRARAEDFL